MGWKPCWGEPPEYALHSWCLLTDETGSSPWRQPCTFIPEPRQGGESAGKVASSPVASCFLENRVAPQTDTQFGRRWALGSESPVPGLAG